jgi:hypothetical protein
MPASYDDVETLVQSRRLADQIVRDLEETVLRPIPYIPQSDPPPPLEPEELLPAPSLPPSNIYETAWSQSRKATVKRPVPRRKARKARSHLHWAVLAMAAGIAVGLWRDPAARTNARRQLGAETQRVVKSASAKLVSARII